MLTVSTDGTISLPDGRVLHTVAATPFRAKPITGEVFGYELLAPIPSRVDQAHSGRMRILTPQETEDYLTRGEAVGMWGNAEGRLLPDGVKVDTCTTYWQVCAL